MADDEMELYCATCRSRETHRALVSRRERRWLRDEIDKAPDGYWMCERPWCRNIRTYLDAEPFDPPLRMPLLD
ncbi:hypothetical protein [Streptomyces sp. NPDC003077]|uniref:hypothetical protein n=1 Tax=Streptomyces sp. NPDC003077 TaxID=3154443 RepID=UPI0033A34917